MVVSNNGPGGVSVFSLLFHLAIMFRTLLVNSKVGVRAPICIDDGPFEVLPNPNFSFSSRKIHLVVRGKKGRRCSSKYDDLRGNEMRERH